MSEPTPWHRLFGMSLMDFFRGMPVSVEIERDLSLKQQFLDVVIIRKGVEPLSRRLPDGFEELVAHNLVTFKSHQESLDGWALIELLGHYVNYRKQASPTMQDLLPETDFRLFAVSARYPQALGRQAPLTPVQPGVYDVRHFTGSVRVVVVSQLPKEEHNALLHLFSAQADLVRYGATHYRLRSEETSTVVLQLFRRYRLEAELMPDVLEQFAKDTIKELLSEMTVEERLEGLSPETRLQGLSPDDALAAFLKTLPAKNPLSALTPEARAALIQRLNEDSFLLNPDAGQAEQRATKE